jgi:hypothetical protein
MTMTIEAEIRQRLKHVPPNRKADMKISNELATHEAGHLVIGLRIGIDEQGIVFCPPAPGQAAGAWCKNLDLYPQKAIIRSFSGLLAHIHLLQNSIAPDLQRAYAYSIIIDPEHPSFHELKEDDREFLSGAKDDMAMAWGFALKLTSNNQRKALDCLRKAELKARSLIAECGADIFRVVNDIHVWAAEPDREFDGIPLYPPNRAEKAIGKT